MPCKGITAAAARQAASGGRPVPDGRSARSPIHNVQHRGAPRRRAIYHLRKMRLYIKNLFLCREGRRKRKKGGFETRPSKSPGNAEYSYRTGSSSCSKIVRYSTTLSLSQPHLVTSS